MTAAVKVIRPSSLPNFRDCARRAVAGLFRPLIVEAGYELKRVTISVGAHVGTAVHAGAAWSLEQKIASGTEDQGNEAEAIDTAQAAFHERAELEGCSTDDTTPTTSTAMEQIKRMVKVYRRTLGREIKPVAVENRLEADVGDGFIVSGQFDAVAREPGRLRDLKTGVKMPSGVGAQLGVYSMLRRTHGIDDIEELAVDYLPRVAIGKEQPPPTTVPLPLGISEQEAIETVGDLKTSWAEFERRLKEGDRPPEMAFRANPSSNLCSAKWCPAHSTRFCRSHSGAQ